MGLGGSAIAAATITLPSALTEVSGTAIAAQPTPRIWRVPRSTRAAITTLSSVPLTTTSSRCLPGRDGAREKVRLRALIELPLALYR